MADQPTQNPLPGPTPVSAGASASAAGPVRPAKVPEKRSLARRSLAVGRRWARDTFNREQFLSSLRSLAWVAPLTLLIWIYAEREQQLTDTARFQITVKSADPTQVASLVMASDQNVVATIKGPKARLGKAKDQLDPRGGGGPVQIVIEGNRPPNQYDIDIRAQIQKDYRLDDSGISVETVNPPTVRVDVDALQTLELPVKADPQVRLPAATFDPPTVKVMAPAGAVRAATAKGELYAKATLPPDLSPGSHALKAVPVAVEGLASDPRVVVRPTTVSATVEVGQADEMYVIDSLPVFPTFAIDAQTLKTHTLRHDQSLANIKVYGPPDKINQLKTSAVRPSAHFTVKDDAIGRQRVQADLKYDLPDGIRLGDDAPRKITFDLVNDPS
jgi:hypothetical protein